MHTIQFIVHCYCPSDFDGYAQMLKWQLASLMRVNFPGKIIHTTVMNGKDEVTIQQWNKLKELNTNPNLSIKSEVLPKPYLFRRAVGRNIVAKESTADVVWFADCDYFFLDGCLEDVYNSATYQDVIYYPERQMISETHEIGDKLINDHRDVDLPPVQDEDILSQFVLKPIHKAIGGLQIVTSTTARKGYLDGTKWARPANEKTTRFKNTKCDVAYRNSLGDKPIRVEGIYRIRHSITGLDIANNIRG